MGTVKQHTLNHQPVALWQLDGSLNDTSGNGFTLSVEAGTVRYSTLYPGIVGIRFDGAIRLYRSTYTPALNLTGDMTFECLIAVDTLPVACVLFSHAAVGETSPTNYSYQINLNPNPSQMGWFSESDAGTNASYNFSKVTLPPGLCHYAVTRIANIVTIYINGVSQGSSTLLTAPTDSTGSLFRLGDPTPVNPPTAIIASVKMIARGLTAAEVKDEYSQTLGLKAGNYALKSPRDLSITDYSVTPDVVVSGQPLKYHTTTFSPVALWNLNGALTDSSGNSLTLTVESGGTERYATMGPGAGGLKGFWFDGATRLVYNTTGSALQITGNMTIEMIVTLGGYSADAVLVSYGGNNSTAVTNLLYNLALSATDGFGLAWSSESGTAVVSSFNSPATSLPFGVICHLAVTRTSNVIQFYLNGQLLGSASSALTTPASGTSSVFHLGGEASSPSSQFIPKFTTISSVKVMASALTSAQVLSEYQATLGNFFG